MKNIIILLSIFTIGFPYNGSITGITYFDYTRENDASAFNFKRQYFNYAIQMSDDIKFKVVFDVGRTSNGTVESCIDDECEEHLEDTRLVLFLKKAQIDYNSNWGKASLGMIGTNTYGIQEKTWGYRFIDKSAMDKNKFVKTADLGIGLSKNIISNLNVGMQYLNGEGYKTPESNFIQQLSLNINYGEMNLSKNSGLNLGMVYSTDLTEDSSRVTLFSIYTGFSIKKIRFGAEFDISDDKELTSIYLNYSLSRKIDLFSRYDVLSEDSEKDQYIISGLVFDCENGLLISPNIRKSNEDDLVYKLNFQFKF
ncbi:hypothetical protein N9263_00695 [Candidatus Marinimicrobia bacterium]|nr:hypothetical protein [Candidatus Neomarinimicrobiota bacterium]